jgi:serine/threonine-protein phosphatase 2A activator
MGEGVEGGWEVPTKKVKVPDDVAVWEASEGYQEYLGFIVAIGEAVQGRKLTEEVEMSAPCRRLLAMLGTLRQNILLHPPLDLQTR